MDSIYHARNYFAARHQRTVYAARQVLGLLRNALNGASVLDLGCGVGTWARVAKEYGATHIKGVDGPWVDRDLLQIEPEEFIICDLTTEYPEGSNPYDIVVWLENIEHLPQGRGEELLNIVTKQATLIVFSGAIPCQGGHGHLNEQWQSYWATLFALNGFQAYDYIRPRIWGDNRIPYWYRQNLVLYANDEARLALTKETEQHDLRSLDIVHPEGWAQHTLQEPGVRMSTRFLIRALKRKIFPPKLR